MRTFLRSWLVPLAVVLAVIVPLRGAVADWHDVPSDSMVPSILVGDRVFVNKLAYGLRIPFTTSWIARWGEPRRGDVVTLASPADGRRLVKRVVAVGGDRLAMRDNRLVLNGTPVAYEVIEANAQARLPDGRRVAAVVLREELPGHPHPVTWIPGLDTGQQSFDELLVPEGHVFFMGDNRDTSYDARRLGPAPLEHVYGHSTHVALSLDHDRFLRPRFERWGAPLP